MLVFNSSSDFHDKDNAYNAGVDIFLTKPVQNDVLMDTLLRTLEKKSRQEV